MSNQPEDRVKAALINMDQAFALAFSSVMKSEFYEKDGVEKLLHKIYAEFSDEFGKLDHKYNIYGDHDAPIDQEISTFYDRMKEKYFR